MTKNIGGIERILCSVAGLVLMVRETTNAVGWWGWLGAVPLATDFMACYPPYSLLGINTCKNRTV